MRRLFSVSGRAVAAVVVFGAVACGAQDDAKTSRLSGEPSNEPSSTARTTGEVVEFRIAAGTGDGAWNTQEQTVVVTVGDTLRIFNDDTINHRLHTNGRPCPHGPTIAPGASFDCVISQSYDAATHGAVYDHNVGPSARFWLKADAATARLGAFADTLFEADNIDVDIPETGEAEYRFVIEDTGFINGMSVHLRLEHTYIGDLNVSLFTPSGKRAILHDRTGGSTDNIDKVYGEDGEANASLGDLAGEDINGEWRLLVTDSAGGDFGKIKYLQIKANRVAP